MPSAKYTEVYKKVSQMGEKLKAAGKQGPSNDEQLNVRAALCSLSLEAPHTPPSIPPSFSPVRQSTRARLIELEPR